MVKKAAPKGKKSGNAKDKTLEEEEKEETIDKMDIDDVDVESKKENTTNNKKTINNEIKENNSEIKESKNSENTGTTEKKESTESPKKVNLQPTNIVNDSNLETIEKHEPSDEKKAEIEEEIDSRSIFVKNVDFSATPEDLEEHFKAYGSVNRITIICDKYTGIPKGYAYVEFSTVEEKEKSKEMNDSLFKGRQIKIEDKRKNIPNFYGKKVKKYQQPMYPQPMMMRGGMRGGYFGGMPRGRGMPIRGMGYKPHFNKK